MGKTLQKKKGFSLPHVYAVILILMLLVAIMTYVVPAGSYVRVDNAVDPDSFTYAEQTPVGFLGFFTAIHQGVVESSASSALCCSSAAASRSSSIPARFLPESRP